MPLVIFPDALATNLSSNSYNLMIHFAISLFIPSN